MKGVLIDNKGTIILSFLHITCCNEEKEMGTKEDELIQRLMKENEEFLKAKQAHSEFSKQLDEMEKKEFLTPQDEIEIKILKKKKLACKDQMERILVQHR
jgi:uncharacterized protein YdcH (DUF465 family)